MKRLAMVFFLLINLAALGKDNANSDSRLWTLAFYLGGQLGYSNEEITASCKRGVVSAVETYAHQMTDSVAVLVKLYKDDQDKISLLDKNNSALRASVQRAATPAIPLPMFMYPPSPQTTEIHQTFQTTPNNGLPAYSPITPPPPPVFPVFCTTNDFGTIQQTICN